MPALGIILEGLLAALEAGVPGDECRPTIVLREGAVVDTCPRARGEGIEIGISSSEAAMRCPGIRAVECDLVRYGPRAEIFAAAAADVSPGVEMISPGHLMIDLARGEDPLVLVCELLVRLPPDLGHSLHIGYGPGKVLADVALGAAGRGFGEVRHLEGRAARVVAIRAEGSEGLLASLSPAFSQLIPGDISRDLAHLGLDRFGDVARISEELLRERFGPGWARRLVSWARGRDGTIVTGNYPPPRRVREGEVENWTSTAIEGFLVQCCRDLAEELDRESLVAKRMSLWLSGEDGGWERGQREFSGPRRRQMALISALRRLWNDRGVMYPKRFRIEFSGLRPGELEQVSILGGKRNRREILAELVEDLDRKFPGEIARWGEDAGSCRRERMLELWDPLRGR